MGLRDLKIGKKLGVGFGSLIILLGIASFAGYNGITNIGNSLEIVGDDEAPLVEAASGMELVLMEARNTMEEFKGATTVIATDDAAALAGIVAAYQKTLEHFDQYADAILKGGTVDGIEVRQTDNADLADLVRQADDVHNTKFQVAAGEMMKAGNLLLKTKKESEASMLEMEQTFDKVGEAADKEETEILALIERDKAAAADMDDLRNLLEHDVPLVDATMELKNTIQSSRIPLEEIAQANEMATIAELEKEYQATIGHFDEIVEAMLKGGEVDGTRIYKVKDAAVIEGLESMDRYYTDFQNAATAMIKAQRHLVEVATEAEEAMEKLDGFGDEAASVIGEVKKLALAEMTAAKISGAESKQTAITVLMAVAGISLVLGVFLGVVISNSITRPLAVAVAASERIAEGDLSQDIEVTSKDETGQLLQAMKDMRGRLFEIVSDVRVSTDTVTSAASEISQGSSDLSQRTEEQASSLEETASSMEELTSTVKQNADNASQANQLAASARTQAEQGGEVVGNAVMAMTEINKSSKRIADIIGVIDEIAFQTNLLALNAAVEAARAGEQGRGFAVVAGEVRKLAQRSADSAKEIKELITDSVEKVDDGSRLVDESGKTLEEILGGVKKVSDIVAEIAAASQEQSSGIEQVNRAVMQMDEVTQQNAALVEETAAASGSLNEQAIALRDRMSFFSIGDGGSARTVSRPEPVTQRQGMKPRAVAAASAKRANGNGATSAKAGHTKPAQQASAAHSDDGEWQEF